MRKKAVSAILSVILTASASVAFLALNPAPSLAQEPILGKESPPGLECKSPSCILVDYLTGEVLYEKNADERRAPASLTKIMTLVVALEAVKQGRVKLDDRVTASEEACSLGGSMVWAEAGETHPLRDWLYAVAVGSANDASAVVAEHVGGTEARFVEMMNQKARSLGLSNTQFKNSHGLDEEGHYVSARDIAILSRYAVDVPGLLDFTKVYRTKFRQGKFDLDNANKMLVWYEGCDGLKTGSTDKAGFCVAATARRDDRRFIAVVMGAPDSNTRFADATRMLNYAFANFSPVLLARKGAPGQKTRVWKGTSEYVDAVPEQDLAVIVKKGEQSGLTQKVDLKREIVAPVKKGDVLGEISVMRDGTVLGRVRLVAAHEVPRRGVVSHFLGVLKSLMISW